MDVRGIILKTIVFCIVVQVSALNLKLTNLQCNDLEKRYGEFTKCNIKAIDRDVSELNVYYNLKVKPITNASLNLRFTKRGYQKHNTIYQYKVDACKFMKNHRRNPLAELFYSFFGLEIYSNLNHSCPYNHDFIVDHCRLNMKPISMLAIAKGEYKIYTTWFLQEVPAAEVDISINVI